VLERVKPEYIFNQYAIRSWEDPVDFLRQFCIKTGRRMNATAVALLKRERMLANARDLRECDGWATASAAV
jgi:hypothetical protein